MCHSDMSTLNMLLFMYHTFLTRECFQVDLPRTVNLLESVHSMCSCVCFFFPWCIPLKLHYFCFLIWDFYFKYCFSVFLFCLFKLNAIANRAAGKGYENEDNYSNIRFQFVGIENIHVMRSSLQKLLEGMFKCTLTAYMKIG